MALKTFNIDKKIYQEYSDHCKEHGISMSKRVENFISSELDKINGKLQVPEKNSDKEHSFSKYC